MHLTLILTFAFFIIIGSARRLPTVAELNRRILQGSKNGNLKMVKTSLDSGGYPDAISKDPGKGSPLHAAANYGHLDVVRLLVSRGANIEVQDTTRHTPLMYAAFEGHIDIVRYLLSVGADVNAACMSGETSLHEAAQGGKTKIVEVLLEHGHAIDPMDTRWSGATPLMWSARWGHTETFQTLLAAGADHKLTTTDGVSLTKWIGYEETVNNPLYNISGAKARLDIQRMLEEL